jgi:hypothetical protein
MKKITAKSFILLNPDPKILEIIGKKDELSALDVLEDEDVHPQSRLEMTLHEEFISAPVLHEFGCAVAEEALARVKSVYPQSTAAIAEKRKWIEGKATDEELEAARNSAWNLTEKLEKDANYSKGAFSVYCAADVAANAASKDKALILEAAIYAAFLEAWVNVKPDDLSDDYDCDAFRETEIGALERYIGILKELLAETIVPQGNGGENE